MFSKIFGKSKPQDAPPPPAPATMGLPEISTPDELRELTRKPLAMVYKHSSTCPVSWSAHKQMQLFHAAHPQVPLGMLTVQKDRALSNLIAGDTGIRHASPQVILYRDGRPVFDTSHEGVTVEDLADAVGQ